MQNLNLHKQRLIALIIAAITLIFMFFHWWVKSAGAQFQTISGMGFGDFGLLTTAGIIGVIVACLMGDKTKPFDQKTKMIALASFGAIVLGAVIHAIYTSSMAPQNAQTEFGGFVQMKASTGIGTWLAMVSGLAGLAWVSGILDQLMQQKPAAGSTPTAPPPPPKS